VDPRLPGARSEQGRGQLRRAQGPPLIYSGEGFADGEVHTLTRNHDEKQLRAAITANGGEMLDLTRIEARNRSENKKIAEENKKIAEAWEPRPRIDVLRSRLSQTREHVQLLKEQLTVQREQFGEEEMLPLQEELKKLQAEIERLNAEIRRWHKLMQKKAP
jgi:hypothetical protein